MFRLIMTWNIRQGKETEYLEFITQDFVRLIVSMGFHPLDAWYTVWGEGPQVMASGVTKDLQTVEEALQSDDWKKLRDGLDEFVINFGYKVVEASGGFQL